MIGKILRKLDHSIRYHAQVLFISFPAFIFHFLYYMLARPRGMIIEMPVWRSFLKRHMFQNVVDVKTNEEAEQYEHLKGQGVQDGDHYDYPGANGALLHLPAIPNAREIVECELFEILVRKVYESAEVKVRPKDVVLDCGSNIGIFSTGAIHDAGSQGTVVCIEPEPYMRDILDRNLKSVRHAARYVIVERPVYRDSRDIELVSRRDVFTGHQLTSIPRGRGIDHTLLKVRTTTIDELVRDLQLPRVDFIKMDIEGAEADALLGATETLKRWKPALALSAYHNLQHFYELPFLIHTLNPAYRTRVCFETGTMCYAW